MKLTKRRWVCPSCGRAKLAPSAPRRDDVRRFCLPCSDASGRMVQRTCPSLDAKREKRKAAKAQRGAAKAQRVQTAATVDGLDMQAEFKRLQRLPVFKRRWRTAETRGPVQWDRWTLKIRRPARRPARMGYCARGREIISVSVPPGTDRAEFCEILVHEMVHVVQPQERRVRTPNGRSGRLVHGPLFKALLVKAMRAAYALGGRKFDLGIACWKLDCRLSKAIRETPQPRWAELPPSVPVPKATAPKSEAPWVITAEDDGQVMVRLTKGAMEALRYYLVELAHDGERLALAERIESATRRGNGWELRIPATMLPFLSGECEYIANSGLSGMDGERAWQAGLCRIDHAHWQWERGKLWSARGARFSYGSWEAGVTGPRTDTAWTARERVAASEGGA